MKLQVEEKVPEFELRSDTMERVELSREQTSVTFRAARLH